MVKRKRNLTRSCKNDQLHTQRVNEWVEMQIKTAQPEEMILQQEINVKIAEEKTKKTELASSVLNNSVGRDKIN